MSDAATNDDEGPSSRADGEPTGDPEGSDGAQETPPGPEEDPPTRDALSPFDRVRELVLSEREYSLAEVAEQAGLPTQILREIFATMDWADQPGYDDRDVRYARAAATILDHYPLDAVIRTLRTRYRSMASIVVSDLGTVRDEVVTPAAAQGADAEELAELLGRTAEEILPLITDQLAEDYRHVLVRLLDTDAVAQGVSLEKGREIDLAVGFVDVVGYTSLSGHVDPAGLDHVLKGFEDLVSNAVAEVEDVLLAKFIGDAAMLVGSDAVELTDVMLRLVEDDRRLAEAPRRAGVACGPVLVREGDYYGPITNLAARLTDHAREWSLLAAEELEEDLEDSGRFELSVIPETRIHGVGERRPLRVRRAEDA